MARRRRDRWLPAQARSLPRDAVEEPATPVDPARPVHAWIHTLDGEERRIYADATWATPVAVLIEYGFGQARTSAWVWRSAVKHRAPGDAGAVPVPESHRDPETG